MGWLIAAAWALFLLDTAGLTAFAREAATADPLGRAIGLGVAQLALIPLGGLLLLLALATWRRSRIALWLGIVLAAAPLVYVSWAMLRDAAVL